MSNDILSAEQKADQIIENARSVLMELIRNDTARKTITIILLSIRKIVETETSARMLLGISQQIKDTLTDAEKSAVSVQCVSDGLRELFVHDTASESIEALLNSAFNVMRNSDTPAVIAKVFDLIIAISKLDRGVEAMKTINENFLPIIKKDTIRDDMVKLFKNIKYLMDTGLGDKVVNFMKG